MDQYRYFYYVGGMASKDVYKRQVLGQAKADGKKTVLLLNICGPVELEGLEELSDAILCVFIPVSYTHLLFYYTVERFSCQDSTGNNKILTFS